MFFLITGRDGHDENASARRMAAREAHIAHGDKLRASGNELFAVAILDGDGKMVGSSIIVNFEARSDVDVWLAEEPYVTGGVWSTVEIEPCRPAPAFTPK